jgi:hypothetical protein
MIMQNSILVQWKKNHVIIIFFFSRVSFKLMLQCSRTLDQSQIFFSKVSQKVLTSSHLKILRSTNFPLSIRQLQSLFPLKYKTVTMSHSFSLNCSSSPLTFRNKFFVPSIIIFHQFNRKKNDYSKKILSKKKKI